LYSAKYIYYYCRSDLFRAQFFGELTGLIGGVSAKKFRAIEIPIPPLSEQERIVSLLDAEFAKIDAIKANAEKQLQDAKALFQSILCNLLSNDSWSYSTIGEVFKTYSGGTPHKSNKDYYENGSIPWINSGEVCQKYIETTNNFITEKGLKNSSAKYYPVNTVLVAMYGATAAQSGILKFEATSNQAVCGLLPNKNYVPEFVYYWFVYNKEKVASMAQGGAQPNLSQVKIKTINIPLISLEDQHQIAEQLDKISAKIHALQSNFDTTVTLCNDLKLSILKDIFG
jgi:type I restriction enzyme S subunit